MEKYIIKILNRFNVLIANFLQNYKSQKVLKSKSSMALLLHECQCYYISVMYNVIEGFTWELLILRK